MIWGGADVINRNKVHNKWNVLESSQNHLLSPRTVEKLSSTKLVPGAKKVGDCCTKGLVGRWSRGGWSGVQGASVPEEARSTWILVVGFSLVWGALGGRIEAWGEDSKEQAGLEGLERMWCIFLMLELTELNLTQKPGCFPLRDVYGLPAAGLLLISAQICSVCISKLGVCWPSSELSGLIWVLVLTPWKESYDQAR